MSGKKGRSGRKLKAGQLLVNIEKAPDLFTVKSLMGYLKCSRYTVNRMINNGLRAVSAAMGSPQKVIKMTDLLEYLSKMEVRMEMAKEQKNVGNVGKVVQS